MKPRLLIIVLAVVVSTPLPAWAQMAPAGDTPAAPAAEAPPPDKLAKATGAAAGGSGNASLSTDRGTFRYGPALTLLRLSVARQDNEPARARNYGPKLEKIAPEIGFQFWYAPPGTPWKWRTKEGRHDGHFQFMSFGGAMLIRLSDQDVSRGGVSLAAILGFFEDAVSLGIGFDLYRGIPVADVNGARGAGTAYTGVASWAFAREGELTPENVFLLFSVNLAKLGGGQ